MKRSRKSRGRHLQYETLEDRRVMDATAVLQGGVLNVVGTDDADNFEFLQTNGRISIEGVVGSWTTKSVKSIFVDLKGGDNFVSLASTFNGGNQTLKEKVTIKSEGGSEQVVLPSMQSVNFSGPNTLAVDAKGAVSMNGVGLNLSGSVVASLKKGVLTVTDANGNNDINFRQSGGKISIEGLSGSWAAKKVKSIVVNLQDGENSVSLLSLANGGTEALSEAFTIRSGGGDHTVQLANGEDITFSGAGHLLTVSTSGTATLDGVLLTWDPPAPDPNDNNPVFTSPNAASVPENTTAVLTVTATDADLLPQALTFSKVGGADQAKFSITSGGVLTFNSAPNFEVPTDANGDNIYVVTVQASDGNGGTTTQTINVTVTPVNDNNPVFTSPNAASVPENTTAVLTVTATDADLLPQALTFSKVGGADQAKFSITSGGVLTFNSAPNFEVPTDANGDNIYVVTVQASDGNGGTTTQTINVTVTPVNDNNPVFTSPNAASVPENTTAVLTVTATDADLLPQALTFSKVGGADQAKFSITSGGVLTFNSAPNFEVPTDANGDNIYVVTVQASDGNGGTTTQTINVTVTPVNDNNPVFTSPNAASVPENTTAVLTVTATDADLLPQALTFSKVGGADQAKFSITSGGVLTFNSAPNFEVPTDANGDNIYVVTVQASDGNGGTTTQTINVTVTPVNDNNPVFTSPNAKSVPENTTAVLTVTATDADLLPQALTFSKVGGADQAKFSITSGGVLTFNSAPNFEVPTDANGDNIYVVTVQASDGNGGTTTQTINVTVTPVNDNNPVFTSPNAKSVPENTTAVLTVTATDADLLPQALTFSKVGGADQAKFSITSGGVLTFNSAPNFEVPTDANGDNIYVVTVQASDGNGGTTTQTINVTVTPVNDNNPVFTSPNAASVPENTTAVLTVTATDADLLPQALTFSKVGGADQAKFSITSGGVLTFNSAPNFEVPTDANGDNVYVVTVQASDGNGGTTTQTINVTVTPVNPEPDPDPDDPNWFDETIQDAALRTLGSSLYIDGVIDRADMLALFYNVQDNGVIDSTELFDLQAIVNNSTLFGLFDYVWKLSSYVVGGNTANATYQGGALGNLVAGSAEAHLEKLVNKWFLGLDRPTTSATYRAFTGSLFVSGVAYTDIKQGNVGDCYLLASLAELALRDPNKIASMFIVNGDGTYTARFYNSGVAHYVTVDSYLPTNSSGALVYAGLGLRYDNASGELWVPLAEKAYVQLNEMGFVRPGQGGNGVNSYAAIASGYIFRSLGHITGQGTVAFAMTDTVVSFTTFVNAWNAGKSIAFASYGTTPSGSGVVPGHAYAVVGYNSTDQTVTMYNPWGPSYPQITLTWNQIMASFQYFDRTA